MDDKLQNMHSRILRLAAASLFSSGIGCSGGLPLTVSTVSPATSGLQAASLRVTALTSSAGTATTFTAPAGTGYSTVTVDPGSGFLATNILSGSTIFGLLGTATLTASSNVPPSNAFRTTGTTTITQTQETSAYAGISLPVNYRETPNFALDDEGTNGSGVKYAPRPGTICGTTGNLAVRIASCNISWDGALNGNSGEALWKLVTRAAANQEVWQDTRTGLLWSSTMPTANWCKVAGNVQSSLAQRKYTGTGNGLINTSGAAGPSAQTEVITIIILAGGTTFSVTGSLSGVLTSSPGTVGAAFADTRANFTITAGTTAFQPGDTFILESLIAGTDCQPGMALQPATPLSNCTENLAPALAGDGTGIGGVWNTTYDSSKGNMGANTTPSIRWRLPTLNDYKQAEIDGMRMVLPDMGKGGASRPNPDSSIGGLGTEWTATLYSPIRSSAFGYSSLDGVINFYGRGTTHFSRCVGR
jgi:hypothetical protein